MQMSSQAKTSFRFIKLYENLKNAYVILVNMKIPKNVNKMNSNPYRSPCFTNALNLQKGVVRKGRDDLSKQPSDSKSGKARLL